MAVTALPETGTDSRSFRLFWLAAALSNAGDAFTFVAFPLLVYRLTGSLTSMALITSCSAIATVAAGLVAGPLTDRFDRRRLLIACDLLSGLLTATIPLAAHLGVQSLPLLLVAASLLRMVFVASSVAFIAFVPELVSKEHLVKANARIQTTSAVAYFIGPALAGVVVQRWSAETAIGVDALSFVISIALLGLVTTSFRRDPPADRGNQLAGLRFVLKTPILRGLALVSTIEMIALAGTFDLFTYLLKGPLAASDGAVGITYAVASLGAALAALVSEWISRRLGLFRAFVVTSGIVTAIFAAVPFTRSLFLVVLLATTLTFCGVLRGILATARRQDVAPAHLLGRVTAVVWLIVELPRSIGAFLVGLAAAGWGVPGVCIGISTMLLALTVATVKLRSLRG